MRNVLPVESQDVEPTKPASLASTDFSSQDGPDNDAPIGPRSDIADFATSPLASASGSANVDDLEASSIEANREAGPAARVGDI